MRLMHPAMLLRIAATALQAHAYRYTHEVQLHAGLAEVLEQAGVAYERERRLTTQDRVDFRLPCLGGGVVIEVKVDGSLAKAMAQGLRYAKHAQVCAVILVSTERWGSAKLDRYDLHGKPPALCRLQRAFL